MALRGLRFERLRGGGYAVYAADAYIGKLTRGGHAQPDAPDPKTLKRAAYELQSRGLLHAETRMSRRSRFGDALVATAYARGREIRVYEHKNGYYVEVPGMTGVPGPFGTIREAASHGKSMLGNYKRRRKRR